MSDVSLDQIKQIIEQMPPDEVEQLRVWLNAPDSRQNSPRKGHPTWGQSLADLIENFPLEEADQMDINDPEAWVHERRRTKTNRRNPG